MSPDPVIAQKSPYAVEVEAGETYSWCACGRSASQPFCDGSHQGTGFAPVAFTAQKDDVISLCGCKLSPTPPTCDGAVCQKL